MDSLVHSHIPRPRHSQYPSTENASYHRTSLHVLPNRTYVHPRHSVMRPRDRQQWSFSSIHMLGFNLQDAYDGRFEELDGGEDELFPASFCKIKIHFMVSCGFAFADGCRPDDWSPPSQIAGYEPFHRQKSVRRVRRGMALSTSRMRVVECIAEAAVAFLRHSKPITDLAPSPQSTDIASFLKGYAYGRP